MMLKDSQGRAVLAIETGRWGDKKVGSFWAKAGDTLEQVEEATICQGNDNFLNSEYVRKQFDAAGFDWVTFNIAKSKGRWECIKVELYNQYEGWMTSIQSYHRVAKISGKRVDEAVYDKFTKLLEVLRGYNGINGGYCFLDTKTIIETHDTLILIGEGNVVTPESLYRGCAKDEERPKILPGDNVEIVSKSKDKVTGTIVKIGKKVSLITGGGKKMSVEYHRLALTKNVAYATDLLKELEPTLNENFNYVLAQKHRLYRAKLEKKNLSFPMFPDPNERQTELTNTNTCVCPLCGWQMAEFTPGSFTCCFCQVSSDIITIKGDEVVLLMHRQPAKNRFAIKEVRCCSNCNLFHFECGRQGRRSTGYCRVTNQCVQAFNTCNYWFPNDAESYTSAMRQHITNLGYGIKDTRNTSRNDIRDTIYRAEDHEKEKKRAEEAKRVYFQAYAKFKTDLLKLAGKVPLTENAVDEKIQEYWKKMLDDGC